MVATDLKRLLHIHIYIHLCNHMYIIMHIFENFAISPSHSLHLAPSRILIPFHTPHPLTYLAS